MKLGLLFVPAALVLSGCGALGMDRQPRYAAQGAAAALPDSQENQSAPAGVVPLDQPQREAQAQIAPPVTLTLVQRGAERYAIACGPCHGALGEGDGAVVTRGFPAPPSFADPHAPTLTGRQLYDVISYGYGAMAPQGERVAPEDRWAIVAYVRALELAHSKLNPAT